MINIPVPDAALWKGEPRFVIIAGKYRARNLARLRLGQIPQSERVFHSRASRSEAEAIPRDARHLRLLKRRLRARYTSIPGGISVIVYHVCGANKLRRYKQSGFIKPPVRGWVTIQEAERFSKQTGRPIILRLKFPENAKVLEGHRGMARYIETPYDVRDLFGKT